MGIWGKNEAEISDSWWNHLQAIQRTHGQIRVSEIICAGHVIAGQMSARLFH